MIFFKSKKPDNRCIVCNDLYVQREDGVVRGELCLYCKRIFDMDFSMSWWLDKLSKGTRKTLHIIRNIIVTKALYENKNKHFICPNITTTEFKKLRDGCLDCIGNLYTNEEEKQRQENLKEKNANERFLKRCLKNEK